MKLSRDADLNPLRVQTGFAVQVSHFADIGTPQSNINNTPVSPYESVTALRVGAQTTRLSSDKGYQNN